MIRSPSLALRPVVSVSRTTWRTRIPRRYSPVGELVGSLVFRMPGVSPNPMPLYLMQCRQLIQPAPQVLVFHRIPVSRFPSPAFPGVDPLGDAFLDVLRIGVEADPARARQRLERADHRGELHAVVGGRGFPAPQFLFFILKTEK